MQNSKQEKALDHFKFDVPQDVEHISIWRGFARDIAAALEIKDYLVSQAMQQLFYVESVRRMYRGAHGSPSVYYLIEPPEQNKFNDMQEKNHVSGRYELLTPEQRAQDSINRLATRVNLLEDRIKRIEHELQAERMKRNSR